MGEKKNVLTIYLHRSDTSRSELAELSKQANPDEIDIDDDDENQGPDGECRTNQAFSFDINTFLKYFRKYCSYVSFTHLLLVFSEVQLEQKIVPAAVFGGLKDD